MKKQINLLSILFMLITFNLHAAILTVSNNTSNPGQYSSLQTAINTASANDTILVAGSSTSYGDISIGKTLILFGAGYHNQYGNNTTIGNLTLYRTNLYISASGSKIVGFIASQIFANGNFSGSVDTTATINNIVIERCQISLITFGGTSIQKSSFNNDTIRNCIISSGINTGEYCQYNGNCTYLTSVLKFRNIYVHNNIFNGASISSDHATFPSVVSGFYVRNNVFINRLSNCFGTAFPSIVIENNIFYAASPQGGATCSLTKNITFMCLDNNIPGSGNLGSGNKINQNPLFVNYPLAGAVAFSYNHDFHLLAGSPGKNAGTDGTDIGIYGGWSPFDVGANPYIPQMIELTLPSGSSVPAGGTLNVHFKARKQN
ncbi:MAG: hypothetical protein HXX13_16095 [Bacteroidetes bacterium]|nr:hypothetical protein [Bacteroidota bacterium]